MIKLIRISAPHFVAGIELGGRSADIIKYMKNWPLYKIKKYCLSKGWKIEIL